MTSIQKLGGFRVILVLTLACVGCIACARTANAAFLGPYALGNFTISQTDPTDGSTVMSPDGGLSVVITGGNNGSGNPSEIDWFIIAPASGIATFNWAYSSQDTPGFDGGGFLVNGSNTLLSVADGESGSENVGIFAGQTFGFFAATADNTGEPGVLTISNFSGPLPVPEPGTAIQVIGAACIASCKYLMRPKP